MSSDIYPWSKYIPCGHKECKSFPDHYSILASDTFFPFTCRSLCFCPKRHIAFAEIPRHLLSKQFYFKFVAYHPGFSVHDFFVFYRGYNV